MVACIGWLGVKYDESAIENVVVENEEERVIGSESASVLPRTVRNLKVLYNMLSRHSIPFACFLCKVAIGKQRLVMSSETALRVLLLFLEDRGPGLDGYDTTAVLFFGPRYGSLGDSHHCLRPLDILVPSVGKR